MRFEPAINWLLGTITTDAPQRQVCEHFDFSSDNYISWKKLNLIPLWKLTYPTFQNKMISLCILVLVLLDESSCSASPTNILMNIGNRISYTTSNLFRDSSGVAARVEIPLKNRSRYERIERFPSKIWAVWAVFFSEKPLKPLKSCRKPLKNRSFLAVVFERFFKQDLSGFCAV